MNIAEQAAYYGYFFDRSNEYCDVYKNAQSVCLTYFKTGFWEIGRGVKMWHSGNGVTELVNKLKSL